MSKSRAMGYKSPSYVVALPDSSGRGKNVLNACFDEMQTAIDVAEKYGSTAMVLDVEGKQVWP